VSCRARHRSDRGNRRHRRQDEQEHPRTRVGRLEAGFLGGGLTPHAGRCGQQPARYAAWPGCCRRAAVPAWRAYSSESSGDRTALDTVPGRPAKDQCPRHHCDDYPGLDGHPSLSSCRLFPVSAPPRSAASCRGRHRAPGPARHPVPEHSTPPRGQGPQGRATDRSGLPATPVPQSRESTMAGLDPEPVRLVGLVLCRHPSHVAASLCRDLNER
jgi:hypothetical protein